MMKAGAALALLACIGTAAAQPFLPGTGFAPLGNLLTTDQVGALPAAGLRSAHMSCAKRFCSS